MARYIDAGVLWKRTTTKFDYCEDFLELIETQPTADVVERKKGEWEAVNLDVQAWTVQCSNCYCVGLYGRTAYCPNCGADMRGEEDGEHE